MTNLYRFSGMGQSVWLNYLRRAFLESGQLAELLQDGIRGVTSSPALFARAIAHSSDYDQVLQRLLAAGMPVRQIYEALLVDDMQRAADTLHFIHEETKGLDGFVSMELDPAWMHDPVNMVAEAQRLLRAIDRVNVMIEIPATPAGIEAVQRLTADGVSVNVTHIFGVDAYEQVAQAYIAGLESYFATHSVWRIAPSSVASFSLSRIDGVVDEALARAGRPDLQGMTAIALAKVAYRRFQAIFDGPRWQKLVRHGGRPLRLKWTRTTPHNFYHADTYYVEALIGPQTVTTLSPQIVTALHDHGQIQPTLENWIDKAPEHLQEVAEMGIDTSQIAADLQTASLKSYDEQFQALIQSVNQKRDQLEERWQRLVMHLGDDGSAVAANLRQMTRERFVCRLWQYDQTLWPDDATDVRDHLGWLHVMEHMQENLQRLQRFAQELSDDGYTHVVLVGFDHAVAAGAALAQILGKGSMLWFRQGAQPGLSVHLLHSLQPESLRNLFNQLNLRHTLFLLLDKQGDVPAQQAIFNYLYTRAATVLGTEEVGTHFAAVTDAESALAELAAQHHFRKLFLNDPKIDEPFGALSYFGLLPAALAGVNLAQLLEPALAMQCNASGCNSPAEGDNVGPQLGMALATLAEQGRNKLTLVSSPAISPIGGWVSELVSATLNRESRKVVPVVDEPLGPPEVYGNDRLFVQMRVRGDDSHDAALAALRAAGHPVIKLQLLEPCEIGGCFFVWQMALASAAICLGVNPFARHQATAVNRLQTQILDAYSETGSLPAGKAAPLAPESLATFLAPAKAGDFVALHTYLPQTAETAAAVKKLRTHIRNTYHLPTVVTTPSPVFFAPEESCANGANRGYVVQLTTLIPENDLMIPEAAGRSSGVLTFGVMQMAQALAAEQALREWGRPFLRFHATGDIVASLARVTSVT